MYKLLESGEDIYDNMVATMRMLTALKIKQYRICQAFVSAKIHHGPLAPAGQHIKAIQNHDLVFGLGPAGTGKTYLAVCSAISCLISGMLIALFCRALR